MFCKLLLFLASICASEAGLNNFRLRFSFPETRRGRSTATVSPLSKDNNRLEDDDFIYKIPNEEQLIANAFQSLPNTIKSKASLPNFLQDPRRSKDPENIGSNLNFNHLDRGVSSDPSDSSIRCIPRIMQVEEIVYDQSVKCTHTYNEKCHQTYVTDYQTVAQNKCETNFKKNCQITFKATPSEETVMVCYTPLVQQCSNDTSLGPEICRTLHETSCETRYNTFDVEEDKPVCTEALEKKCTGSSAIPPASDSDATTLAPGVTENPEESTEPSVSAEPGQCEEIPVRKCTLQRQVVKKVQPNTACKNVPKEVCIPSSCNMVPGDKICSEDVRVHVQNLPQEECDIQPEEVCHMETILVPRLVTRPNCIKVPRETCVNLKVNPRKEKKPVLKEWCYKPSELAAAAATTSIY